MATWTQKEFGSYNSFIDAWQLPAEQLQTATNVITDNGSAVPMRSHAATALQPTSAVGAARIHKINYPTPVWVTYSATNAYLCQYNDMVAIADSGSYAYITNGVTTNVLGLQVPTTSPSPALGGGTGVTGTNIQYYVAFLDDLGQHSGLSDGSTSTVSPSNQSVVLTNIPLGPTGTTKRWIYRLNSGAIQFVDEIPNNTFTGYIDTTPTSGLGSSVDEDVLLGGPPENLTGLGVNTHQGRMIGFEGRDFRFSAPGLPYAWKATNRIQFPSIIKACGSLNTTALILMTNEAQLLDGSDYDTFAIRRGSRYGTNAPWSLADCGQYGLMYWSPQGLVLCDGQFELISKEYLSSSEVATLEALASSMKGAYWRDRYYLFHSQGGLIYNLRTKQFSKTDQVVDAVHSNTTDDALYVLINGTIHEWEHSASSRTMTVRTKEHNPGTLDGAYHVTKVAIEHVGALTVRFIENGSQWGTDVPINRTTRGNTYVWTVMGQWGPRQAIEVEGTGTLYAIVWNPEEENK